MKKVVYFLLFVKEVRITGVDEILTNHHVTRVAGVFVILLIIIRMKKT